MTSKYKVLPKDFKWKQFVNLNDFVLLLPILIIALFFRVIGLDWDQGFLMLVIVLMFFWSDNCFDVFGVW